MSSQCAQCESKECRDGKDCFSQAPNHKQLYQDDKTAELHRAASAIEGRYYGKEDAIWRDNIVCKGVGV